MLRVALMLFLAATLPASAQDAATLKEWPRTDFTKLAVPWKSIRSGGPDRDGIPALDHPRFLPVAQSTLPDGVPVIALEVGGEARAYPLGILNGHEIVNDRVGGIPVAVTFCPLCHAAVVFDRRVGGRERVFGVTGRLRGSDLIMFDRETESWWQQYEGRAIAGAETGTELAVVPSQIVPFSVFRARHPAGEVLQPVLPGMPEAGQNLYVGYDATGLDKGWPFMFDGKVPEGVFPLLYVVAVGTRAWTLDLVQDRGRIEEDGLVLEWRPGMNSALDGQDIATSRDMGWVEVSRGGRPEPYRLTFAFVFFAFEKGGELVSHQGRQRWK